MALIIELTRALAEGPSAIGGGREAAEERLWAAAKLIFIFIFLQGVCSSACPPQRETKGPCHTQTARAVWFWVALMGADSMRSLLEWRAMLLVRCGIILVAFCVWPCHIASVRALSVLSDGRL